MFRPIAEVGAEEQPFLFSLSRAGNALSVQLTDCNGWWNGEADEVELKEQLDEADIDNEVSELVGMVQACFEERSSAPHSFAICRSPDDPRGWTVEWATDIGYALRIRAAPAAGDASQLVRERLVLPALRAAEQLRRMLPADAEWTPPHDHPLPLPSAGSQLLLRIMEYAAGGEAGGGEAGGDGGREARAGARGDGGGAAGGAVESGEAAAGGLAATAAGEGGSPDEAGPPRQPQGATVGRPVANAPAATAPPPLSQEQREQLRRKRAMEQREAAAAKAAKKARGS